MPFTLRYVTLFRNTTSGRVEAWADQSSDIPGGGVLLVSSFETNNAANFLASFANANVAVG